MLRLMTSLGSYVAFGTPVGDSWAGMDSPATTTVGFPNVRFSTGELSEGTSGASSGVKLLHAAADIASRIGIRKNANRIDTSGVNAGQEQPAQIP